MKKAKKYKIVKAQYGTPPRQEDFPDYESFAQAMDEYMSTLSDDNYSVKGINKIKTDSFPSLLPKFQQPFVKQGLQNPSETLKAKKKQNDIINNSGLSLTGTGGLDDVFNLAGGIENAFKPNTKGAKGVGQRFFGIVNPAARITTNILNKIQDNKNEEEEYKQYLKSLQPVGYDSTTEEGLNDLPIYTKYGGSMKKGGKWIPDNLKKGRCTPAPNPDCPVGSPQYNLAMTFKKHNGFHKAQNGIEEVEGVGENDSPKVEAEEGEVFTTKQGQLQKVQEGGGTHEEGGVLLNNVDRVLEDTSDKRKDKISKMLKVSPMMAKLLSDVDIKTEISHSKLMEKAKEQQEKYIDKIQKKIENNVNSLTSIPNNKYAKNSMDMNIRTLNTVPKEGEIFDKIFDHQEFIKTILGAEAAQKAKNGGKYTITNAQNGYVDKGYGTDRKPKGNAYAVPVYNPTDGLWYLKPRAEQDVKLGTVGATTNVAGYNGDIRTGKDGVIRRPVSSPNFKPEEWKYNDSDGLWYRTVGATSGIPKVKSSASVKSPSGADVKIDLSSLIGKPITDADLTDGVNRPFEDKTTVQNIGSGSQTPLSMDRFNQPKSEFNEPLNWFDVAGPISGITEGRIPVKYNPIQLNQMRLKLQNPLPALQNAQGDYNAALNMLPKNTVGQANLANIFSKKYSIDNQILGQYENINNQIKNQEIINNMSVRDKQELANQAAREVLEGKYLGSKEAQRKQKKTAWDELYQRLAQNKKLNREGNLLMKLFPAFNQNAEYNNYRYQFRPPIQQPKPTN